MDRSQRSSGRFNLEINLDPRVLTGELLPSSCRSELEQARWQRCRKAAHGRSTAEVVLVGILPTLSKSDLSFDNITPMPRYYALNEAMNRLLEGGAVPAAHHRHGRPDRAARFGDARSLQHERAVPPTGG